MDFLAFDIYAKRMSFFYNNQEKIGSYFGLFLTLLYIILSIVLLIYYILITIERKEIKVYDSTLYAQEMPFINIDKNDFYFAFGLEDPAISNRFVDETIYHAEVLYIDRVKINGEFNTTKKINLPLEKCKEENFGENYQHLFIKGELKNSYCLKDFDYNLTFSGGYKYEKMSYIRIKIFPCKNSTENNNHCKSQNEIDYYMSSGYFSILLKDVGLNPSNYSYPTIPTLQDLYTTIDRKLNKNYILNFGITEIHTDTGLINEYVKKDKYIQFRKDIETFTFRDESEYLSGKEIFLLQLRLDDTIIVQKRAYTKIGEILSRIGGYMQLMYTIFLLISLLVNTINSELKIINSIFKFNKKKNKMILKYQNLQSLNIMIHSKTDKPFIFTKKNIIKNIKTTGTEYNKSNNNLIIKKNNASIISSMNANNYNNQIKKIPSYKMSLNKSNNAISLNERSRNNPLLNFYRNNRLSNANRNKICLTIKDKETNPSVKDNAENIGLNLFDYFCPGKNKRKRKMKELYHLGKNFYRKRMDIVFVFSHILLTEKALLKINNNNNNKKKSLNLYNELVLNSPKKDLL